MFKKPTRSDWGVFGNQNPTEEELEFKTKDGWNWSVVIGVLVWVGAYFLLWLLG